MKRLSLLALVAAMLVLALSSCTIIFDPETGVLAHHHTYGGEWKSDADNHYKVCECDEKSEIASHTDTDGDLICDVCGYELPAPVAKYTVTVIAPEGVTVDPNTIEVDEGSDAAFTAVVNEGNTLTADLAEIVSSDTVEGVVTYTFKVSEVTSDISVTLTVTETPCEHNWDGPTCTEGAVCTLCGEDGAAALGHTESEWITDTAPDCTTAGTKHKECTECHTDFETGTIDALGHTESEWITDTAPDCTTAGTKHTECTVCHIKLETGTIDALGHDDGAWETLTAPDCENTGIDVKKCTACKAELDRRTTDKVGHAYGAWTSNNDGTHTKTCANNSSHTETEDCLTAPTCTDGSVCADCGYTVDKLGHGWSAWTSNGDGTHTRSCSNADHPETESCSGGSATCTEEATCESCGAKYGSKAEHSYTASVVAPTCTEPGYTKHTCSCGDTYNDTHTEATGHTYGEWTVTTPATCTEKGIKTAVCTSCSAVTTESITASHKDENNDLACDGCGAAYYQGKYTFADYPAGTQYADDEVHVLDHRITVTTTDAHFTSELRIYSSARYDGFAIISSTRVITNILLNLGENDDTLDIYGSVDGTEWTLVGSVASASEYSDQSLAIPAEYGYKLLKLDVAGTQQVRVKYFTVTLCPIDDTACRENGHTVGETVYHDDASHWNLCTVCESKCNEAAHTAGEAWESDNAEHWHLCSVCSVKCDIAEHTDTDSDKLCDSCGKQLETSGGDTGTTEAQKLATFEFGANRETLTHADGSSKTSYSETSGDYTLSITAESQFYTGAFDATGNSCIKLGSSKNVAKFTFTVDDNVTSVKIYIAGYKDNNTTFKINGTSYSVTTHSDDGVYTCITIDTTTDKTISFESVKSEHRAMINTIEYYGA